MTQLPTGASAERQIGPDVARCAACLSLVGVHFFLQNGFYKTPVTGASMFFFVLLRMGCMLCVPTFLLLTGYLMRDKTLSRGYYGKAGKTVFVYLVCSVICVLFRVYAERSLAPERALRGILGFTAAPYGWYIEMYLGLFLLVPFLNVLYKNLPTRRAKQVLIATLLVLTTLPAVINVYNFTDPSWWAQPASSPDHVQLIPQWWKGIYPLTYYYLGAYVGEYGLPLPSALLRLCALAFWFGGAAYAWWRSRGALFVWGAWCDWGSVFNVGLSVCVFTLLTRREYRRTPRILRRLIAGSSQLCLGAYLLSYVFDRLYYAVLRAAVPSVPRRLGWFFVFVPLVFISSLTLALAPELLYRGVRSAVRRLRRVAERRKDPCSV